MDKLFSPGLGLALLRWGSSILLLLHGVPKIKLLSEENLEFPDPLGVGPLFSLILTLIGEVVAPILIIIGFKTRLAAIPAFIAMLVAALIIHAPDPFSTKELALIYALCFLVILVGGPGKFELDNKHS